MPSSRISSISRHMPRRALESRPVVRLVEHRQPRPADEGEGDAQPLSLAAREVLVPGAAYLGQAEALEEAVRVESVAVEGAVHPHELDDGEARVQELPLRLHAHHLLHPGAFLARVDAEDAHPPAVGLAQPDGALDRRRLARPVAAEDPDDLPALDGEAHAVDDGAAP